MSRKKKILATLAIAAITVAVAAIAAATWWPTGTQELPPPSAGSTPGEETQDGWAGEVVITEYADFNCGYCAAFAATILPRLKADFLDDGKARMEFRHYPFLDGSSWEAARAYECAAEQGHEDEYHDWMFNEHGKRSGPDFSVENLKRLAGDTRLEQESFDTCLDTERHLEKVEADKATGQKVGVQGTPAVFINGKWARYNSYEELRQQIAAEIGRSETHVRP